MRLSPFPAQAARRADAGHSGAVPRENTEPSVRLASQLTPVSGSMTSVAGSSMTSLHPGMSSQRNPSTLSRGAAGTGRRSRLASAGSPCASVHAPALPSSALGAATTSPQVDASGSNAALPSDLLVLGSPHRSLTAGVATSLPALHAAAAQLPRHAASERLPHVGSSARLLRRSTAGGGHGPSAVTPIDEAGPVDVSTALDRLAEACAARLAAQERSSAGAEPPSESAALLRVRRSFADLQAAEQLQQERLAGQGAPEGAAVMAGSLASHGGRLSPGARSEVLSGVTPGVIVSRAHPWDDSDEVDPNDINMCEVRFELCA